MSLIEEALRRAKDPFIQPPPTPTPPKAPAKTPKAQKPDQPQPVHSWIPALAPPQTNSGTSLPSRVSFPLMGVAAVVLCLALALLIGGIRWMWRTAPQRLSGSAPTVQHATTAAIEQTRLPANVPSTTASTQEPGPKPALALSGIVGGLGQPYAVINGTIVSEGERVGTATLVEITKGAVRLRRDDGTDLVLTVPR